jgi:hypothetical protein
MFGGLTYDIRLPLFIPVQLKCDEFENFKGSGHGAKHVILDHVNTNRKIC